MKLQASLERLGFHTVNGRNGVYSLSAATIRMGQKGGFFALHSHADSSPFQEK